MTHVTRIDHISMAVRDLEPQIELLERLFGFRYRGRFTEQGAVGAELEIPGYSGISWELLAPDGPDSHLHRFLDSENGPGIHHIALEVADLDEAIDTMRSLGIEPWGYEAGDADTGDPVSTEGVSDPANVEWDAPVVADDDRYAGREGNRPKNAVAYVHPRGGGAGFLFQLYDGTPGHLPEPFDDERSDSLGIIAVNAIAHAHHSRHELGDWYERLFGLTTLHQSNSDLDEASFSSRVLETPDSRFRIEVIQPTREDSFLQHFLDLRGPAIHHVSFEVRDIDGAVASCARNGVRVLGRHSGVSGGANWSEAFLAPEHTGGMLVQIFSWEPIELAPSAPPVAEPEYPLD